ncbi:MAG TPA: TIR domain-containing protein [Pyrinomonadaceae bacterium]
MSYPISKTIYISYSDEDKDTANQLSETLQSLLGEDSWMREFDLNGGGLLVEEIGEAIADAKWFILLLSVNSINSRWLRFEFDLATLRAIEDLGVKLIILKLDQSNLPRHLEVALSIQPTVDVSGAKDLFNEFFRVAEYINQHSEQETQNEVYVDRGESSDQFSLLARRNKIISIFGWPGIGKSSFVTQSVSKVLNKSPLIITINKGFSLDYLARQILRKSHVQQPLNSDALSDEQLLLLAIDALTQRASRLFLFLDNAELALDGSGELLSFLERFLAAFIDSEIPTHIVLATTRNPSISAKIGQYADLLPLGGLAKKYIRESVDLWLEGTDRYEQIIKQPAIEEVVSLTGGHPLAAKLLASYLKVKPAEQLLTNTERQSFELKLARHILQSTDTSILDALQKLILQILATVQEAMTVEDLLSVEELSAFPIEDIHRAKSALSDYFLIEQDGEYISLHNFLVTYYRDQVSDFGERRDKIAYDVGMYAYNKALALNSEFKTLQIEREVDSDDKRIAKLSNEIFRYAIPASRLLLTVGEEKLAEELPISVKGTLREMVFFLYQEKRDFKKALRYAEKWLELNPNDSEIVLYRARCLRNFRDPTSIAKAEEILSRLDPATSSRYFATRLYREKALLAETKGDKERAKAYFREGIALDREYPYVHNYVGLAKLLIDESRNLHSESRQRQRLLKEAIGFLKKARSIEIPLFDRFHLGLYIEALTEVGDNETALQLLNTALKDRPNDSRLNYAMAEILRKRDEIDQAEPYAKRAFDSGAQKAPLSLANILYDQAQRLLVRRAESAARTKLRNAISVLAKFKPEYGDDEEVADTIRSKVFRALNDYQSARDCIKKYSTSTRTYTIYEHCRVDVGEAMLAENKGRVGEALALLNNAMERLNVHSSHQSTNHPLAELRDEVQRIISRIESRFA